METKLFCRDRTGLGRDEEVLVSKLFKRDSQAETIIKKLVVIIQTVNILDQTYVD
jgi:hypothetical protein